MKKELLFLEIFLCLFLVILLPWKGYTQGVMSVNCNEICIATGYYKVLYIKICGIQVTPASIRETPIYCLTSDPCCFPAPCSDCTCDVEIQLSLCPVVGIPETVYIPECPPFTIDPPEIKSRLILPRFTQIIINGANCYFDETSTVTIEDFDPWQITVNRNDITNNQIKASLVVPPKLRLKPSVKKVTVTTGSEVWTAELKIY